MSADQPLVSLVVLGYQQESLIQQAIDGAFAQDYPNLEIILSDDHSSDGTFKIMADAAVEYTGKHKVILNKNPKNLGITGHINRIFELASGELIVANAGDDISMPDRTTKLATKFEEKNPLLIYSDVTRIEQDGSEIGDWSFHSRVGNRGPMRAATAAALALGAACGWHKDLYRLFGKIEHELAYEDLVFSYRAILAGRIEYVPEALVKYRLGGLSHWGKVSEAERRARKVRGQHVQLAVCRQRLDDTRRFAPGRGRLVRALRKQIAAFEQKIEALEERQNDDTAVLT